jgi:hypothetical protein
MPSSRMKQRRVVHKSTAGILKPNPEAVDLVGNPLTSNTVAPLRQAVCDLLYTLENPAKFARVRGYPES